MKLMFYLVDTSGKELADCLEKATADGKLPNDQDNYTYNTPKNEASESNEILGILKYVINGILKATDN
jgi:hypothetical protein